MLEVQEKKLKQAIDMLELLGLEFKVIRPDGFEYGKLEVKPPAPPKPPKPAPKVKNLPKRALSLCRSYQKWRQGMQKQFIARAMMPV